MSSPMTYAYTAWEFTADTHLLVLQNMVSRSTGNFPWRTQTHELRVAYRIPHVHDFMPKICRQQAEVIRNHDNESVLTIGQVRGLNLAAVKYTAVQMSVATTNAE